jgi:hypothetical protein
MAGRPGIGRGYRALPAKISGLLPSGIKGSLHIISRFSDICTELKNYGVSEERWGWRREGEQGRTEEYSEYLLISPFSSSPHCYTPNLVSVSGNHA